MIRINLLGRPRPKVKRRVAIAGTLQLLLFAVPVLLAVGVLVVQYVFIKGDINELQVKIEQKESEKRTMAQLEKEIKEYEEEQRRLQGRLDVIEGLKRNQAGPVRLLEAVGNTGSPPETLWLTSRGEQGGGTEGERRSGQLRFSPHGQIRFPAPAGGPARGGGDVGGSYGAALPRVALVLPAGLVCPGGGRRLCAGRDD